MKSAPQLRRLFFQWRNWLPAIRAARLPALLCGGLLFSEAGLPSGTANAQPAPDSHRSSRRVLFLIGEDEYNMRTTLPEFARSELASLGILADFAHASASDKHRFEGLEKLSTADLLVVAVRRRSPPADQMAAIRQHISRRKPMVGIRTASHAFEPREPQGGDTWPEFDREVLGADYRGHHAKSAATTIRILRETAGNPILAGVHEQFTSDSHLYQYGDLFRTVTPLLEGDVGADAPPEPAAWINTAENRRVFYTSLGTESDFREPNFRRLLRNGIFWALELPIPATPVTSPIAASAPPPAAARPSGSDPKLPLSPVDALQRFQVAEDLVWEQVLTEPEITQPVFLNFDERGRMWVVEYRQYPQPAGLKMVSRDNFWRAVYDRIPQPPPHHVRGADRITIHEDQNGDGTFETHRTFIDGLNIATSVCQGRGGVWILNPPYLLFYPDRDHNDVPDGDPTVHLAGFGLEDTHSVVNSLRWGPGGIL